jgi:flagellin-like protein
MMMKVERILPATGTEDKNMQNENQNDEAVSPVIATILMVAITVVLAGVLYVWAESLAEGNTEGSLELYVFSGVDGAGDVTDGNGDDLVRISMDQGEDLNWASVTVKISVDGAAPVTCANNAEGADGFDCHLVEYGDTTDQFWSVGDGVTVVESGGDSLCSLGETCSVEVSITDTREGKIIDKTTAIAE